MMHMVSTGTQYEIANVDGACAQCGGSASGNFKTSSPDIPCLQAARLFVLLASVQEV
jgi:hypothetical protein